MKTYLYVAFGSALAGVARFWISSVFAQRFGDKSWFATLLVNVTGSFLIGLLASLSATYERFNSAADLRHFLIAGFCGGYTTFSAFSLQTLDMLKAGAWIHAAAYSAGSVFCSALLASRSDIAPHRCRFAKK